MFKNAHIWLPGYVKDRFRSKPKRRELGHKHIIFCIVDHFEPRVGGATKEVEKKKIKRWFSEYSSIADSFKHSRSGRPRHTLFYPLDEYSPEIFDELATCCGRGCIEIELHMHHDKDTEESLREKLILAKSLYSKNGALARDKHTGGIRYGFIHGNWSLDNSRRDGRWCGVNNELEVLRDTGCYADFTLPSAPSDTQTAKINSIYYAKDTPEPKSHNTGVDVEVGKAPSGDLMIIQGPLALNWKRRKFGVFPRIENSGIPANNPISKDRIDLWVEQSISVKGRPEWIFVKVYTHGAKDEHLTDEFFSQLGFMFSYLEEKYNDGINYKLHYVTAREMYNIIKAAEAGEAGDPGNYRDYLLVSNIADHRS